MDNRNIQAVLSHGKKLLNEFSKTARLDAEILMAHVINEDIDKIFFIDRNLSVLETEQFLDLIQHRKGLQPIAYLTGSKEFWGLNFKVNEFTLIPRPDTEILIESLASFFSPNQPLRFLDLGTGSGCIGITVASIFPKSTGILVDQSKEALAIAEQNITNHKLNSRIDTLQSDWFVNVPSHKFDLIVSNPPYISPDYQDIESIKFEPKTALYADDNGLMCYKAIAKRAKYFLSENGYIILEIGFDQANDVINIFKEYKFIKKIQDYGGNDRVLIFKS